MPTEKHVTAAKTIIIKQIWFEVYGNGCCNAATSGAQRLSEPHYTSESYFGVGSGIFPHLTTATPSESEASKGNNHDRCLQCRLRSESHGAESTDTIPTSVHSRLAKTYRKTSRRRGWLAGSRGGGVRYSRSVEQHRVVVGALQLLQVTKHVLLRDYAE